MKTINERLKELQPYVASIRFVKDLSVIDTFFKPGWTLPKSDLVGNEVTADKPNYYMLYPNNKTVGVDEMLDYAENVIFLNEEREQKLTLLKLKVKELQTLFRGKTLVECKRLKFTFPSKVVDVEELSLVDIPLSEAAPIVEENVLVQEGDEIPNDIPIEVEKESDDVIRWNNDNSNSTKVGSQIIELPPKKVKIELEEFAEPAIVCKCGPNDVCPVCVKG